MFIGKRRNESIPFVGDEEDCAITSVLICAIQVENMKLI
jgi:hypothetical protein